MFRKISSIILALALVLAGSFIPLAEASTTLPSNLATVALTATVPAQLTVSTDTSALNFTSGAYSNPVHFTVGWNLPAGVYQNLDLAVFFTSAVALSSPSTGAQIPTSQFFCQDSIGQNPMTAAQVLNGMPLTWTCPGDFSVALNSSNLTGSATLAYQFAIPSLMAFSAASDYSGTLNIQAFVW
jgi:hypothetical protein